MTPTVWAILAATFTGMTAAAPVLAAGLLAGLIVGGALLELADLADRRQAQR